MRRGRNVLFLTIDQLRGDCLTGALAAHAPLPNLRALMREAVTFARHYAVTSPCGPSRASLLTGQYAMNHRSVRNGTPLRHDTPTLPGEMLAAGYLPLLFGYTDTSRDPRVHAPEHPAMRTYEYPMAGFLEMVEMRAEDSRAWRAHLAARGVAHTDAAAPGVPPGAARRIDDPAPYAAADSDTAFLTDAFLDRIRHCRGRDWFAHLTYLRPHPPLIAPAPYHRRVDPASLPLPRRLPTVAGEAALHPFFGPALRRPLAGLVPDGAGLVADDATVQALRAVYLGLAAEVDHHVGRVLAWLRESGEERRTLVVITADHGEMLGDRHGWGKMTVYDAAFHVPLLIRAPDLPARAGTVVDRFTESVDIAPTILDWLGRRPPNSMDGVSLLPFLSGAPPPGWRRHAFSELDFANPVAPTAWEHELGTGPSDSSLAILREERLTLVEFAADLPPLLFDHAGAGEFENVAADPARRDCLLRLTRALLRHRMRNMDHTLSLAAITEGGPRERPRRRAGEA